MPTPTPAALARCIAKVAQALAAPSLQAEAATALSRLVARDDWLPAAYAQPHADYYQQYLLHADPAGCFSIVSFVWGPGQATPIHDHGVWGIVGQLRGAEASQRFAADGHAPPTPIGAPHILRPGDIDVIGPDVGDVHQVSNAHAGVSVSIHLYGTDIGRHQRHVYPATGGRKPFISGYVNGPDTPPFSA